MKTTALFALACLAGWATAISVIAAGNATLPAASGPAAAPVPPPADMAPVLEQTLAGKDLPATQPVADWNTRWNSYLAYTTGFAILDRWVYVMSTPNGYFLRFERDPATARLTFREATEMHRHTAKSWGGMSMRKLPDGNGILYVNYGAEQNPGEDSLWWYRVDAKSGAMTLINHTTPSWPKMPGPYGYGAVNWNPDMSRWYKAYVTNIIWYSFKEDGTPVQEGSAALKNPTRAKGVRPRPNAIFSPDGKNYYLVVEKSEPTETSAWQVDQYDIDAKTGTPTYVSSLDLPDIGIGKGSNKWVSVLDITPDGHSVYLVCGTDANRIMALNRDLEKGTLSVSWQKEEPAAYWLGGAYWERGKFRFNADGKGGYFTGRQFFAFTRDPATDELTMFPIAPVGKNTSFEFDPTAGNLYLGGDSIRVYKTPTLADSLMKGLRG